MGTHELEIEFEKLAGIPLGIQVSALNSPRGTHLVVGKISAAGSVDEYNRRSRSPFQIKQGDIITRVNNLSERDVEGMADALRVAGKISLTVRRGGAQAAIQDAITGYKGSGGRSQASKATNRPAASEANTRQAEPAAGAGQSSLGFHGNSAYSVASNGSCTLKFDAVMYNSDGTKFGLEVVPSYTSRGLEVKHICDSGLVPAWNATMGAPYRIRIGDIIAIPNGRTCRKTIAEWRTALEVKLTVLRPVSSPGELSAATQGSAALPGASKRQPPPPPPLETQRPAAAPRSLLAHFQSMEDAPSQTPEKAMPQKGGKASYKAGKSDKGKGKHGHGDRGDGTSSSAVERWVPANRENRDDKLEFQVSMTRPTGTKLGIVVVVQKSGIVGLSVSRVVFDGYIAHWNKRSKAPKRVQVGDVITVVNGQSGQDKLEDMCVQLSLENKPLEFTVVRTTSSQTTSSQTSQHSYAKAQTPSKGQASSKGQSPMAGASQAWQDTKAMSKGSGQQWLDDPQLHSNKKAAAVPPPPPPNPPVPSRRGAAGYGDRWQGWHPADSLRYDYDGGGASDDGRASASAEDPEVSKWLRPESSPVTPRSAGEDWLEPTHGVEASTEDTRWIGEEMQPHEREEVETAEDIAAEALNLCNGASRGSELYAAIAELPCAGAAALLGEALEARSEIVGERIREALPMMDDMQYR